MRGLVSALDHCSNLYNVDGERGYKKGSTTGETAVSSHVNRQSCGRDIIKDAGKAKQKSVNYL